MLKYIAAKSNVYSTTIRPAWLQHPQQRGDKCIQKFLKIPLKQGRGGDVGSIEAQNVKSPLAKFPPTTAVQIDPANTVTHSNRTLKVLFAVLFKQTM